MKNQTLFLIVICTVFFISCEEDLTIPNQLLEIEETTDTQLDSLLLDEMEQQDLVGMAVAVYEDKQIAHLKSYGFADWESKRLWDYDDISHWASISKPLTSVAAFKLYEEGHLSLNDKVGEELSYWPSTGNKGNITLGHLLSNRSGISHYHGNNTRSEYSDSNPDDIFNAEESVDVFDDPTLQFNPGTSYQYSTQGFCLAGAYLDHVAKQAYGSNYDYVKLVKEKTADPLKMKTLHPTDAVSNRPLSFVKDCDYETVSSSVRSLNYILPGGGWSSTVGDMMLFGKGVMEGEILEDTTVDKMWTHQSSGYAYGWNVRGSGSNKVAYHSGSKRGYKSILAVYPEQGIVIAVLTNSIRDGKHIFRILELIADQQGYYSPFGSVNSYTIINEINCDTTSGCLQNSTYQHSGVWRTGNNDQLIRRGLTQGEFGDERVRLQNIGYEVRDLEIYQDNGQVYYDGIFNRQQEVTKMWRNWDDQGFHDIWDDANADGYRLFDIEVTSVGGERRWSGLFKPGSGGYGLYRYMDDNALIDTIANLKSRGFRMIDLEPFYVGTELNWAGVWTKDGLDGKVYINQSSGDLNRIWNDLKSQGYRLIDIEKYVNLFNQVRWSAVFYENTSNGALYRNWDFCGFMNKHYNLRNSGRELVDYEIQN